MSSQSACVRVCVVCVCALCACVCAGCVCVCARVLRVACCVLCVSQSVSKTHNPQVVLRRTKLNEACRRLSNSFWIAG